MARFKVNKKIKLPVAEDNKIYYPDPEDSFNTQEFDIIGVNEKYNEYLVKLNPDMLGYILSSFYVVHLDVDKKHEGQKFWFVPFHVADRYN